MSRKVKVIVVSVVATMVLLIIAVAKNRTGVSVENKIAESSFAEVETVKVIPDPEVDTPKEDETIPQEEANEPEGSCDRSNENAVSYDVISKDQGIEPSYEHFSENKPVVEGNQDSEFVTSAISDEESDAIVEAENDGKTVSELEGDVYAGVITPSNEPDTESKPEDVAKPDIDISKEENSVVEIHSQEESETVSENPTVSESEPELESKSENESKTEPEVEVESESKSESEEDFYVLTDEELNAMFD